MAKTARQPYQPLTLNKMEKYNEVDFELHGAIQILHDYTLMHLRKRNCIESVAAYEYKNGKVEPFDAIKSLQRIKRTMKKVESGIENLLT